MEPFNISRAHRQYRKCRRDNRALLQERQKKTEILIGSVQKELEACKDQQLKYQYIENYLSKEDVRAGLMGDLHDKSFSNRGQSRLQKFLHKKLILGNKDQKIADVVPDSLPTSVVEQKFKKLMQCERKLTAVNEKNMLASTDDFLKYLEGQNLELTKIKVKDLTQMFEHLWGLHWQTLIETLEEEFELSNNKAILFDDMRGISETDKKRYFKEYYVKTGVYRVRSATKMISKLST